MTSKKRKKSNTIVIALFKTEDLLEVFVFVHTIWATAIGLARMPRLVWLYGTTQ